MKKFYEERVRKLEKNLERLEYPYWFEPAVKYWIQDFQQNALNFVNNSWEHDKAAHFQPDGSQNFSASAYDMFVYFHKVCTCTCACVIVVRRIIKFLFGFTTSGHMMFS